MGLLDGCGFWILPVQVLSDDYMVQGNGNTPRSMGPLWTLGKGLDEPLGKITRDSLLSRFY